MCVCVCGGGGGGQIVFICQQFRFISCNLIFLLTSLHVEVIHRNAQTNTSQMHNNIDPVYQNVAFSKTASSGSISAVLLL